LADGDGRERDLREAEARLLAHYEVEVRERFIELADPPLRVRVLEAGAGDPLVLVHGSGMAASTWAPLLAELRDRHVIAPDLPGFGLSDRYDYSGRPLHAHAVAQMTSLLDALELERPPVAGTSLGAMWTLCLAAARAERVSAIVPISVPAVALPGMRGDPYFKAMTTPVLGALVGRMPAPPSAGAVRKSMRKVIGAAGSERTPDVFYEVVHQVMRQPGWKQAMRSHLPLAMRYGRPLPENFLADEELSAIATPAIFVWGAGDVYGAPEIGQRAAALMQHARVEVIPGGHAPFLDDPRRCAELIAEAIVVT
jgi:pimeloyl-ACP methyl ester carboxylesterase